jgi:hypothetical protein
MQFIAGTPVGIISDSQEIVEVKLWEVYIVSSRSKLHVILNQYAVDRGPVENIQHEPGRIVYRFTAEDWENDVKPLLYNNRIPVIIKPTVVHTELPYIRREQVLI